MMTAVPDKNEVMQKLEMVRNIKDETSNLEKMHGQLRSLLKFAEKESNLLKEYKKEMDHLVQEKMSHVEELRLIHADINLLETTIKQSESERERQLEAARQLHEDFGVRLSRVNHLRAFLGLEQSADTRDPAWQKDLFEAPEPGLLSYEPSAKLLKPTPLWGVDDRGMSVATAAQAAAAAAAAQACAVSSAPFFLSDQMAAAAAVAAVSGLPPALAPLPPHPTSALTPGQPCPKPQGPPPPPPPPTLSLDRSAGPLSVPGAGAHAPPTIRQQPPPMKSCLSCHQQIHRNAPICPLCKAKSRSRNPKKPKQRKPPPAAPSSVVSDAPPQGSGSLVGSVSG